MTPEPICRELEPLISEWIDGTLERKTATRVERHLALCLDCRGLADDLRRIVRGAAALEPPSPPDAVWRELHREVAEVTSRPRRTILADRTRPGNARPRSDIWRSLVGLAAAAGIVAAIGLGWMTRDRSTPGDTPAEVVAGDVGSSLFDIVEVELRAAEAHYDSALAGWTETASDVDSPDAAEADVTATFQESLAVVDQAIEESRAALAESPDSVPAQDSLFEGLRRKVALLQDAIALVNAMRQGNQLGAARIAEGMQD